MKPTVFLDMDGVLADFDKKRDELNLSGEAACMKEGFFQHLPLIPDARLAVDVLWPQCRLYICSAPYYARPESCTEKLLWLKTHFPQFVDEKRVVLTKNKGLLHGLALIDDRPDWSRAIEFQGNVIHFKNWRDQALPEIQRLIQIYERG